MKKTTILFILWLIFALPVYAANAFVVNKIQVEGLQRISADTVYSYLPIHKGETLQISKTGTIIKALYKTGFFEHITLARQGNTLVIKVVERPTIGEFKITGNSFIPTDKLNTVMKSLDIAEGRVYNRAILDKIKQSLLNQYYQLGRYNARVDVNVTPEARNRVLVKIEITEGLSAKIRRITIIGNHAFSKAVLIKKLSISTPGILTIVTQADRYSQEKLDESLENLHNYYMDHGYLKFIIKSSQIAITPDRKSVYVIIAVDEGVPYIIKGYNYTEDTILSRSELDNLIKLKSGQLFSRQAVLNTEKTISEALGNKGYAFATVSLNLKMDDVKKQVYITFQIKPGKRAYVRHIYFTENSRTNDEVLRREILQMEGSTVSTKLLDESKHRLNMLPYMRDVEMAVIPVPGHDDQVDVKYKLTEDKSAQATFSVGYSQVQHIILGAGVNQKNFLGTGKTVGVNFSHSNFQQYYGISYTNPYFTPDGISRTMSVSLSKFNPRAANISSSYTTDEYDISDMYSIPVGLENDVINRVQLGYGYQETLLHLRDTPSNSVIDFVTRHGRHFQQLDLNIGFSRDSRDKAIFPTNGMIQAIGADLFLPFTNTSLYYYTANYDMKWYKSIADGFITTAKATLGYGSGFAGANDFPFFKNYYAGGIGTVRGYYGNSLGPQDSDQQPFGGNLLAVGSLGLVFPNYISDNLRTTAFVDGGNVYDTFDNRPYGGTASGTFRYSAGLSADWLTPFGLVDISLARALNAKHGDSLEIFQFSLGANFG